MLNQGHRLMDKVLLGFVSLDKYFFHTSLAFFGVMGW
jgi:hypothetical protein